MERILFKKIDLWIFFLLILFGIAWTIIFGWMVRHQLTGGERLGSLGNVIIGITELPSNFRKIVLDPDGFTTGDLRSPDQRFGDSKGFKFNFDKGTRADLPYLLLNRYDGDLKQSVTELVDLNKQTVVHSWKYDLDPLWKNSQFKSRYTDLSVDASTNRTRNMHTLADKEGNVYFQSWSPLVKADICGKPKIFSDKYVFHHSQELDHEGNIWAPAWLEPQIVNLGVKKFKDDAIVKLSPGGEILFEKSVIQIFIENGMGYFFHGDNSHLSNDDPVHLNEIEPVLTDGTHWKKGDVFLSLAHVSVVLLYRPSTNKIIWLKHGPWTHQHDVDILDDNSISVFDNVVIRDGKKRRVNKFSDYLVYNFSTGKLTSPFRTAFQKNSIRTISQGRSEKVDNNTLFIEETDSGRTGMYTKEGAIVWEHINRASDGQVYRVNWSRIVSPDVANGIISKSNEANCG